MLVVVDVPLAADDACFAAIVARLRILLGIPAEIIPKTHNELIQTLAAVNEPYVYNSVFTWLERNNYSVIRKYGEDGNTLASFQLYNKDAYADLLLDAFHKT